MHQAPASRSPVGGCLINNSLLWFYKWDVHWAENIRVLHQILSLSCTEKSKVNRYISRLAIKSPSKYKMFPVCILWNHCSWQIVSFIFQDSVLTWPEVCRPGWLDVLVWPLPAPGQLRPWGQLRPEHDGDGGRSEAAHQVRRAHIPEKTTYNRAL